MDELKDKRDAATSTNAAQGLREEATAEFIGRTRDFVAKIPGAIFTRLTAAQEKLDPSVSGLEIGIAGMLVGHWLVDLELPAADVREYLNAIIDAVGPL